VNIARISAVTLKVASMRNAVRFYRDVLGMEIIHGGEDDCFSSLPLKTKKGPSLIWNKVVL
jgi:catechol 2,3-dioxygenase-like lactoylglutathione lyase family enzyme